MAVKHVWLIATNAIREGEAGLGPEINDKPLPGFLIKFQVRHGMGTMPSFKKDRISRRKAHILRIGVKACAVPA